ncbi:MAG: hypothetical protein H8F28_01690 [Fibrella sp.]|nr:hypothetical protein [Armatimonadota bacterium]
MRRVAALGVIRRFQKPHRRQQKQIKGKFGAFGIVVEFIKPDAIPEAERGSQRMVGGLDWTLPADVPERGARLSPR